MSTVVATAAVVATWFVVALMLAAVGLVARRGIVTLVGLKASASFCVADLWTGLSVLTAYLLAWSVVAPIGPATWVAPVIVAVVGVGFTLRRGFTRRSRFARRWPWIVGIPLLLLVIWLANLSLGRALNYDSGLYHFGAIEYARDSAAIPGLGNLAVRLSAGDAHLLFVGFLGIPPWSGYGQHLANGLIVSLLVVHIWTILRRSQATQRRLVSWRVALFTLPAIVIVVAPRPLELISSPSIDLPASVLVIAAAILLAQAFERSLDVRYLVGGIGALATAAATRPLVFPALAVAVVLVLLATRRRGERKIFRVAIGCLVLPSALAIGLSARQTILSGYPLWPSSLVAAPVDWRVPRSVLANYTDAVTAWGRDPGKSPGELNSLGDWLGGWITRTGADLSVTTALTLALLSAIMPLVFRGACDRAERRGRTGPATVILIPSVLSLGVWFVAAPDPRFAYGWIWLIAFGLLAWFVPTPTTRSSRAAASIVAVILMAASARACLDNRGGLHVVANEDGPFGSASAPAAPRTIPFVTNSGLALLVPAVGDQCWRLVWCTPNPNAQLEQRTSDPSRGFVVSDR